VIGMLSVRSKEAKRFGDEELRFLESLSSLLATSLQRVQTEEALNHAQRLESVGQLTGGIAHDFNNILGAILGNVELARADLDAEHPARAALAEIQQASLRARDLVRQILTFSRRRPQQLQNIALRPIIEETFRLLRATLPAGVELQLRLDEAPLYANADATQLQQVLMNLCTNAWHALPGEVGQIVISLDATHVDAATARLRGLAAGPHVHLCVQDNGSGMSPSTLERIFEPFFTTKSAGQGTGLGLSVVHGIVVSHQGSITVDSELGRGSSFHVHLPATSPPPAMPRPAERAAPVQAAHGEHVVYLDDDETVLLVMVRTLQRAGYGCTGFRDAGDALAAIRDASLAVDVFITDYNMPGLSGLEVAREVAALRPGLPIAICSGLITDELCDEARRAGILAVIEKEDAFREIVPQVARLLGAPRSAA
jgi:signal transduction histidine kinase/CheY-like chemotaxis protein